MYATNSGFNVDNFGINVPQINFRIIIIIIYLFIKIIIVINNCNYYCLYYYDYYGCIYPLPLVLLIEIDVDET